jgi:hypothetical protein
VRATQGVSVLRANWLDHWLLAGRDPYKAVSLLRFIRLQMAFIASMLIVVAYGGFLWYSAQQARHDDCVQRNQRTVLSVKVLDQAAAASRADGDSNMAQVWAQWARASRESPLPKC